MAGKNEIIRELTKAYWDEIETVMNYLANSVNLDGVRAEEIKKSLAKDVMEELGHAQLLAKRIKELLNTVPGSKEFKPSQNSLQPPRETTDVVQVIKGVIDAVNVAVEQYNKIINICDGSDYVTQDMAIKILSDEETHRTVFVGYLKEYSRE
jgi:bacterioferritin